MATEGISSTYRKMWFPLPPFYHLNWKYWLSEKKKSSHTETSVRRAVVEQALTWLLQNNRYYQANEVNLNQDALAQLPEDGNLSTLTSVLPDPPATQQFPATDEDPYGAHLAQSFVPNAVCPMTEQEAVRQSVQDRQTGATSTLMWPTIGGTPINEFTTEVYFSMAFPTLFPTGAADFLGQRCNQVTIGYYFKHLLMYEDGHFATHPRFRFFALNTEMRWRALQAGQIYIRQHPGDAQLSLDELRDMVGREGEVFSNRVLHYAASLRAWYQAVLVQAEELSGFLGGHTWSPNYTEHAQ